MVSNDPADDYLSRNCLSFQSESTRA